MNKFTLPAGTTNRHQWHKQAIRSIKAVTSTFNQKRELWGTVGGEERESLVSIMSFSSSDPTNPKAVDIYNDLGDKFAWTITRDNADIIAKSFAEVLPKCRESIPVEDNRKTPDEEAERLDRMAQDRARMEAKAAEKAERVEKIADELRKQYPDAKGQESGKSSHARAAANFKRILTAKGLRVSVKSESYSMGNSVRAKVLTPDLSPEQREELETLRSNFTYGTFDAMTDCTGYDHTDHGEAWEIVLGRSKHCFIDFTQSDENKAAILEFLGDDKADDWNGSGNAAYRVWTGAHHSADEFWTKWAKDQTPYKPNRDYDVIASDYSIEEHTHTKRGFNMFIVIPSQRLERDHFNALRNDAKSRGGWYSRKWGATPGGFAFRDHDNAEQFALDNFGSTPPEKPRKRLDLSDKFHEMADKMQSDINNKLGERLTNTPKRQREAASARIDGHRLKRTQEALRKLADLETIPPLLAGFTTKKAIYKALKTLTDSTGYYHIVDTGEHSDTSAEASALWELVSGQSEEEKQADALREKIQSLQFANIPGYFPTPEPIVKQMLDHAQIEPNHSILEPSAGSGAILDHLPESCFTVVNERNHTLCEILQAKGYDARPVDFMQTNGEFRYDRVLMNPPFENLQDVDHVQHAFGKLKSGGRLVAIMSPGPFYRGDKKCEAFRDWFESLGGESYDLPPGSFKESGTGVASKLVVIDSP